MEEQQLLQLIASVVYPDIPRDVAISYVQKDLHTGERIYSMREIVRCVEEALEQ